MNTASSAQAFRFLAAGLDTLEASYAFDMSTGDIDFEQLAYLKERLKSDPDRETEPIELGGLALRLHAFGGHPYSLRLSNEDMVVRLAERMQPSCHVKFSSKALWHKGLGALSQQINGFAAKLRLKPRKHEVISRADWAFDYQMPGRDFGVGNFVSRADKDSAWRNRGRAETFSFGVSDIVIRIYDKSAEIAQVSGKTWFHEIWGCKEHVWRIEFQVRRQRLRQSGINAIQDLILLQGDLLRELAAHHTSLREATQDSNRSRWPFHPLWEDLFRRIDKLPQTGLVRDYDPENDIYWRRQEILKGIYGYLKALGAIESISKPKSAIPTLQTLIEGLPEALQPHSHPEAFRREIDKRLARREAGRW